MDRQKQTKHIGKIEGPLLLFGGVYSNLQALESLYDIATEKNIPASNIICTGDIIGYCAEPESCIELIRNWGIHSIAGNVELQLRDGETDCGCDFSTGSRCDTFSRQWYPFAQKTISYTSIEWMKTLPDFIQLQYAGKTGVVVHGSYFHTSEFIFNSTPWEQKSQNFKITQSQFVIAGHCGLPFNDVYKGLYWLNPGVIGMPANDGTTRVWFMILNDDESFDFQHHSFEYEHSKAAQLMNHHSLPGSYAQTLKSGIWDNCEILPEEETQMQGIKITLDDE